MQPSTNKKQEDTLNTSENAKNNLKEDSLIDREPIPNTPFWIIHIEKGWFLVMGDYRLSEILPTKEEIESYLLTNQWKITMHMCAIVLDKMLQEKGRQSIEELSKEVEKEYNEKNT